LVTWTRSPGEQEQCARAKYECTDVSKVKCNREQQDSVPTPADNMQAVSRPVFVFTDPHLASWFRLIVCLLTMCTGLTLHGHSSIMMGLPSRRQRQPLLWKPRYVRMGTVCDDESVYVKHVPFTWR
jgi:hypothetical protein